MSKKQNNELTDKDVEPLKKVLEDLSQAIIDNKPFNKGVLEAKLLRTNLELARGTLDKLKKEDFKTIRNILIGAGLSFILTISSKLFFADNARQEPTELQTLIIEQNKILIQNQNDYHKVNLEILSLQKEIDSLKGL